MVSMARSLLYLLAEQQLNWSQATWNPYDSHLNPHVFLSAEHIMAPTITEPQSQWHTGEKEIHSLLKVSHYGNPTYLGLSPSYAYRVANSPLVAFGTLDREGRPWTTVWGGEAGLSRHIADGILGVRATTDDRYDPVLQELFAIEGTEGVGRNIRDGELVRSNDVRKPMSGLEIDLETRDRVKLAGRFLAGAVSKTAPGVGQVEMAFSVEESLGNVSHSPYCHSSPSATLFFFNT